MNPKIFLFLFVVFFCSCYSDKQELSEIDSLKMVNDSISLLLESEKYQIGLLQISISKMNQGYYIEAINGFNNILSEYPNSIFDKLIFNHIDYCRSKLKYIDSAAIIKTELQTLAEKKTGIHILSTETNRIDNTPILFLKLKNISKKEISNLKVEVQFMDESDTSIIAKGNYVLDSKLGINQTVSVNVIGDNEIKLESKKVFAKILIQTKGELIFLKDIPFKIFSKFKYNLDPFKK